MRGRRGAALAVGQEAIDLAEHQSSPGLGRERVKPQPIGVGRGATLEGGLQLYGREPTIGFERDHHEHHAGVHSRHDRLAADHPTHVREPRFVPDREGHITGLGVGDLEAEFAHPFGTAVSEVLAELL